VSGIGLVLVVVWVVLVAGVRGVIQYHRTGHPALRVADPPGSAQWWSRVVSRLGLLLAIAAPIAQLAGLAPIPALDRPELRAVGFVLYAAGIAITLASQATMGASWRGDVDPEARTELVTTGPFRLVRNPILTGTATTVLGLALVTPNLLSVAMLVCIFIAMQIQVRRVEEPYLLRVHGESYRRYAERTGRFLPLIGRLPADP
jgi:protein-S-isoprenylcysteine O-methyltransferase Ste14